VIAINDSQGIKMVFATWESYSDDFLFLALE